ncbi:uncharacterized protein HD556DRAFT_1436340 [Suillus plorans]|uniref:Uncharacterized protein n=1 Tax=Suillus plorans TaxID=116603 RepID=A0A9P7DYQ4_9AGAM|nr:uncharacterized protein HD556DRAFT_1436340 [Suillus plorans]KAG1806366.1 hypothetical protein HD556DRAFT_1436340 [Suillus plorans]
MSKHAGSGGDEPPSKCHCTIDVQVNQAVPQALYDNGAWEILAKFLTTSMSLSEVDDAHIAYLGNRYLADEWAEPRRLLFSSDQDDAKSLENFTKLWKTHIPNPPEKSSVSIPASRRNGYSSSSCAQKSCKLSKAASKFIADKADVGDDEEEEEEYDGEDWDGPSTQLPIVTTHLKTISPTEVPKAGCIYFVFKELPLNMLLNTFGGRNFPVIVSAWSAGQLYVVVDSPATIAKSLPLSLYLAVKEYSRIAKEEHEAVECTQSKFPQQAWVRIKDSKYRGDIAQVFEQLPNGLVAVLIVARDFPYSMPSGSRALIQRSLLLNQKSVSDIIHDDEVVGWKYKGESYYMGLLLKNFHRDRLELVTSPHVNDIQLHLDSGWNQPFLNETVVAFSMQFLCVGDWARVIKGSLRGELGQVVSTDHTLGTLSLQSAFNGHLKEMEV